MKQITTAERRVYEKEGKQYPSVTTIIGACNPKPALVPWAIGIACDYIYEKALEKASLGGDVGINDLEIIAKDARKEAQKTAKTAADIGTRVHELAEEWAMAKILGGADKAKEFADSCAQEPEEVVNAFTAFLLWCDTVELRPVAAEIGVWNDEHQYAGMCDLVADVKLPGQRKHRRYVIDLKSSKSHYAEHAYQVAAYAEGQEGIEGIGVLRLDKETGAPDFRDYTKSWSKAWRVFKKMAALYHEVQNVKGELK